MSDNTPDNPSYSPEAEKGLCSCVMQGAHADSITEDMFLNRGMWALLCVARDLPDPTDLAALVTRLRESGQLEIVGGPANVVTVRNFAPSGAQLPFYLKAAKAARLRRRMRDFAGTVLTRAIDPAHQADDLASTVESEALMLRDDVSAGADEIPSMRDSMMEVMQNIEERVMARKTGKLPGIASGLPDLDAVTKGFRGGRVYVFGARPGMGKTSLIRQILLHAAREVPVYLLNLEMSVAETYEAMISTEGSVDYGAMQEGELSELELARIQRTTCNMLDLPIHVDDRSLTASAIESTVRRMVRSRKVGMFAIDYLQLVRASSPEEERSPLLKITNASNTMVRIAKAFKIPVIAIVQLNREAEDVKAAELSRAYIRDCGQIEQDASFIGLLGRHGDDDGPVSVDALTGLPIGGSQPENAPMPMAIKVAKNRQGRPDGLVPLVFRGQYLKFESKAKHYDH